MDDGGFWISFAGGEPKTTVVSLVDDRCDSFAIAIWRRPSRAANKIWC
jgi:hypothetical protein